MSGEHIGFFYPAYFFENLLTLLFLLSVIVHGTMLQDAYRELK